MLGIAAITYLPLLIYVVPEHNAEVQTEVHNQENESTALIEGECKSINKDSIKTLVCDGVIMLAKTTNFDLVYTAIERAVYTHQLQHSRVDWCLGLLGILHWFLLTCFFVSSAHLSEGRN